MCELRQLLLDTRFACEMLLYFGAFRRVTTDTRSVFLFPYFVF
jgi:hypothetical protein